MKENVPALKICNKKFFRAVRDTKKMIESINLMGEEMDILIEIDSLLKKLTWEQKHEALDYFKKIYNVSPPTITKNED